MAVRDLGALPRRRLLQVSATTPDPVPRRDGAPRSESRLRRYRGPDVRLRLDRVRRRRRRASAPRSRRRGCWRRTSGPRRSSGRTRSRPCWSRCRRATAIGGRLADRRADLRGLCAIVLVASALLALVPFVADPFLRLSVKALGSLSVGGFLGSLAAVLVLVAVPVMLLGTVAPYANRLSVGPGLRHGHGHRPAVRDLDGRIAGRDVRGRAAADPADRDASDVPRVRARARAGGGAGSGVAAVPARPARGRRAAGGAAGGDRRVRAAAGG